MQTSLSNKCKNIVLVNFPLIMLQVFFIWQYMKGRTKKKQESEREKTETSVRM